ncbi:Krueppel homolog 2 [Hermetia illucens]|nr:Krueppel homolog 2 [Hermetia illucens]
MNDDQGTESNRTSTTQPPPQARLIEHVKENKIDVALWATRVLTIVFAIGYVFPIFGTSQNNFNKVLLANAATSALRLHQRIPSFAFNREFLNRLIMEDSCHYLLFSLIFFYVSPVFLIVCPVVLFAVLHASSYSLKLLDIIGQNSWWGARFFISIVEFQTTNILRLAAFSEIFLMPLTVILVFMGRAGLMTPFVYYHFLFMRYMSRRNPYTRTMFTELRMATESLACRSPPVVSKILRGGVAFVSRLAPQTQVPPPQAN